VARKRALRGFSLMELVIVLTAAAALGVIAMLAYSPTDVTARYQAEQLRGAIRHSQMLAMAWGVTLRVRTTGSSYSVTCDTSTVSPCPGSTTTPITDPATGNGFGVSLGTGLTLGGPATDLRVDALGRPRDASALLSVDTSYFVNVSGITKSTITVKPITGFAMITP
jgi:Tfp pilus assembly major pilin PilA